MRRFLGLGLGFELALGLISFSGSVYGFGFPLNGVDGFGC